MRTQPLIVIIRQERQKPVCSLLNAKYHFSCHKKIECAARKLTPIIAALTIKIVLRMIIFPCSGQNRLSLWL
jgi:translation initiation factor IF-3